MKYYDWLTVAALFSLSLLLETHLFFNWDASWHLLAAKRILAGNASYANNLVDDNLPMVFWFFVPAVLLHQWTGINVLLLARITVYLTIFISFILSNRFLSTLYKTRLSQMIIRYALLTILLFGAVYEFAQRDTLVIILLFPYIILTATHTTSCLEKGLTGLCAGVAAAMNPFYMLVIGILSLQKMIWARKITLECTIAFAVILLNFCAIKIYYPGYFSIIIPSFLVFCAANNAPLLSLLLCIPAFFVYASTIAFISYVVFRKSFRINNKLIYSLFITLLTIFLIFLLHRKLWESHVIPFILINEFFLVLLIAALLRDETKAYRYPLLIFNSLLLCIHVSYTVFLDKENYKIFADQTSITHQFIRFFNQHPKNSTVYLFSYELVTTFSFLPYTTVNYLPGGPNLWTLVKTDQKTAWITAQQTQAKERIFSDFENKKPDFVLVDTSQKNEMLLPNLLAVLAQHARFRQSWAHYHCVRKIGNYAIYRYRTST